MVRAHRPLYPTPTHKGAQGPGSCYPAERVLKPLSQAPPLLDLEGVQA